MTEGAKFAAWGVIITRLIMTGKSLFGGFIIARDTGDFTSTYLITIDNTHFICLQLVFK